MILLLMIFMVSIVSYWWDAKAMHSVTDDIDFNLGLSLVSVMIFVGLCSISIFNRGWYFLLLPIVVLNLPNAINDFFFTFWAGPVDDRGASAVSLFTHIDLFILLGMFSLQSGEKRTYSDQRKFSDRFILLVLVMFALSILGWLVNRLSYDMPAILFFGNNFQIRYLLYISFFLPLVNSKDCDNFLLGLAVAAILLIIEAVTYTYVMDAPVLTSGNFGTNTLAVTFGFLTLSLGEFFNARKIVKFVLLFALVAALIATETKSAMLAMAVAFIIQKFFKKVSVSQMFLMGAVLLVALVFWYYDYLVIALNPIMQFFYFPDYDYLTSQNLVGGFFGTMITRLFLWSASIGIMLDFPLGIGVSNFNYYKESYGFPIPVFIDPHNDYLNAIVQHGWFSGSLLLYLVYVYPLLNSLRKKLITSTHSSISIMIFLTLTSLTNSNLNKHQLFFMVVFIIFVMAQNKGANYLEKRRCRY